MRSRVRRGPGWQSGRCQPGERAFAGPQGAGLLAHEAAGFQDWGVSAALAYDLLPASDQGLSLALRQSWGAAASGGMDALLDREALAGLRHTTAAAEHLPTAGRLEGEAGYGIALFGGAFTGTPNLGFGLSAGGARDYRVGVAADPGAAGSSRLRGKPRCDPQRVRRWWRAARAWGAAARAGALVGDGTAAGVLPLAAVYSFGLEGSLEY